MKRRLLLTLLLGSALGQGACTTMQNGASVAPERVQPDARVPFELVRNQIFVPTYINGQGPFRFLLDTGASGAGRADIRLGAQLSLPVVGQEQNSDGVNVASIDVVEARTMRVGTIEVSNARLYRRDYNRRPQPEGPMMGIIGRGFFENHTLTIDFPKRVLIFSPRRLRRSDPGTVALIRPMIVSMAVGDETFEARIDTGSDQTLHIPRPLMANVEADEPVFRGTSRRANTSIATYNVRLREPVRVGNVTAHNVEARTSDLAESLINVGTRFLQDYVVAFDQRSQLISFLKPQAPAVISKAKVR